jgi:MerR family transcriptional regulator, mercuric resistance operon regulatory protein
MRSAEVATEAGVNVQTLRYYERRGLLAAPARLPSGYRDYRPETVRTVRFVKRAQQLGFSLEEIETLLDLAAGGPASCEAAKALAAEKISALDQRIATLAAMRESLRRLVTTCERPPHRRECPLLTAFADDAVADGGAANGE